MSDLQQRYTDALMNTFGPPRLVLTCGAGSYMWDETGKRYLDLLGGIAVNSLGHGHPALLEAVTHQLGTLGHVSNFFATEPQVRLAERLLDLLCADQKGAQPRPNAQGVQRRNPLREFLLDRGRGLATIKLRRSHRGCRIAWKPITRIRGRSREGMPR